MTDSPRLRSCEPVAHALLDFRTVFDDEFDYVWNTLRRLGVREADLKDQTQEVFLIVHQLFDDYDRARPIRPWLFGIAYRYAARYKALARHTREILADPSDAPALEPPADEQVAASEERTLVLHAIERIELTRRAVFVMAEIDGWSMPEIAEVLAIPLNTAYSRLRLARRDFTRAVERLLAERRGSR